MSAELVKLVLYSRLGCHLCEDMEAHLREVADERPFELEVVDIDTEPALVEKYDTLVPVLEADGRILCNYFLDLKGLHEHLESVNAI